MEQTIAFNGTISWRLFKSAQWRHLGARSLFLLLFPVGMTAYFWLTGAGLPGGRLTLSFIVAFAFVPLMLAFNVFGWRRTYTKSPNLHKPLSGSVSRDKLIVEGATGRTEMSWDQFVQIREARDFILLYQAPNMFNILAREFFDSDDSWEKARRFATRAPRK